MWEGRLYEVGWMKIGLEWCDFSIPRGGGITFHMGAATISTKGLEKWT